MAGCFGSSGYDQYLEQQLDDYLNKKDNIKEICCPTCGEWIEEDDLVWDRAEKTYYCPYVNCKSEIEI